MAPEAPPSVPPKSGGIFNPAGGFLAVSNRGEEDDEGESEEDDSCTHEWLLVVGGSGVSPACNRRDSQYQRYEGTDAGVADTRYQ